MYVHVMVSFYDFHDKRCMKSANSHATVSLLQHWYIMIIHFKFTVVSSRSMTFPNPNPLSSVHPILSCESFSAGHSSANC